MARHRLGLVRQVLLGRPRELRPGCLSSLGRQPVERLGVELDGVAGDACADTRHHGGPEKALHAYPFEHYSAWHALWPQAGLWRPGAFGENLSTQGLDEASQCIGDVLRIGSALVQVSQGRLPCWKLNIAFGQPDMARRVQDSGRMGWYLRVLQAGSIEAGDAIELLARPHPMWSLAKVQRCLFQRVHSAAELEALAELPELSPNWRERFARRRDSGEVEADPRRLLTPTELGEARMPAPSPS